MIIKTQADKIESGISFVETELAKYKVPDKKIKQTLLTLEELLVVLVSKSKEDSEIDIKVEKFLGKIRVKVKALGEAVDKTEIRSQMDFGDELSEEEIIIVQNLIEQITGDNLHIKSSRGINRCQIEVAKAKNNTLRTVFVALILGLFAGFVLKYACPGIAPAISESIFAPIDTLFLNALKMIVGPLVFLSMANSVMEFDDIKSLGKIAGKVLLLFILTSLCAICVGYLAYRIMPIGNNALLAALSDSASTAIATGQSMDLSVKDLLVGIIPTNIISPFLEMNMLQIIFMGILLGIAIALVGKDGAFAKLVVDANKVVLKITALIILFLPLSIFASMAELIISIDLKNLLDVAVWIPACYLGYIIMLVVYAILLAIFARMNPLKFFGKIQQAMITAFCTASSNATMPVTMDNCKNELKISPKVYAFSIPFGATVNMDGNCITLVVTTFFMAKSFGIAITPGMMLSLVVAIMALSMGSPGIPGGNLVCMTILFPVVGIPPEAVSIVMGLYCIVSMMQTLDNVAGDVVVTTIVAKSEKLIEVGE